MIKHLCILAAVCHLAVGAPENIELKYPPETETVFKFVNAEVRIPTASWKTATVSISVHDEVQWVNFRDDYFTLSEKAVSSCAQVVIQVIIDKVFLAFLVLIDSGFYNRRPSLPLEPSTCGFTSKEGLRSFVEQRIVNRRDEQR
jgi:hypothetical protein